MQQREQLLKAIQAYKDAHGGCSPSEDELATLMGLSRTAIRFHINKMITAGSLKRGIGSRRSLEVAGQEVVQR